VNDRDLGEQIKSALAGDLEVGPKRHAFNFLRKTLAAARQRILILEEQLRNEMDYKKLAGEACGEAEDRLAKAQDANARLADEVRAYKRRAGEPPA